MDAGRAVHCRSRVGRLSEREFLVAGAALYAGEGAKTDGWVKLANSDPAMVRCFCAWLRHFFDVDETRLRAVIYLHMALDLEAAVSFWSEVTGIPPGQFNKPYRAVADPSIRTTNKHDHGCVYVVCSRSSTHRAVMGLVRALLASSVLSGVAQLAEQAAVNRKVVGSSPTPGAVTFRGP